MDLIKQNDVANEHKLEELYREMCRICLRVSDGMNQIFTMQFPSDSSELIIFLRRISELKIMEDDLLPDKICRKCAENVIISYNLVQLCIASDATLRNQETRRMLRKIEAEALEEDTATTNDLPFDNIEQTDMEFSFADEIKNETDTSWRSVKETEYCQISKSGDKYLCEKCMISFSNKLKYHKHLKIHDDAKTLKCVYCSQKFSKQLHLKVHLRSHIKKEDKQFVCLVCGEHFMFEYLLKQHCYKHTDEKPFPCKKCGKGCFTAESLRRHEITHNENYKKKSHICSICEKSFTYASFLLEHMKNHTGEKPYLCSVCGKGFRQSGALHYHQRIHTGFKPFSCEKCNENFMSQSVLRVHMRKHTNERPYVCNFCGTSFRQSTDLKNHHRIHTGEKRVLCTICGKKLSTTGQLTIHLRSHTGEKPYSCLVCSKSFATKTSLVKHQRIHTGEKPFVCDICGKSFNQSSTLKTHSNTHRTHVSKKVTCHLGEVMNVN